MPEISLPDIKLPDFKFRDGKLRDLKMPDIDLRDRLPDVDLSRISLPGPLRDLSMPEVSMPDMHNLHLPEMHMPDLHRPDINVGNLKAPKFDMSDVDLRGLDPRRMDLSGLDPKRIRSLVPFAKAAPKPLSPLPWVIVAGVGGLFAGWWLATSSVTGPRVRQMAAGVRGRIDEWRNARADWDDQGAEARTEGFWSNEHGWKEEGSQGDAPRPEGDWADDHTPEATSWDDTSSAAAVIAPVGAGGAIGSTDAPSDQSTIGSTAYEPDTQPEG